MDVILAALDEFRQGELFPVLKPYLAVLYLLVVGGLSLCAVGLVLTHELLADLRTAIRRAGYTDSQVAAELDMSTGNLADRLSGERPFTFGTFGKLPVDVLRWFAVGVAERLGVPMAVRAGASLRAAAKQKEVA